MWLENDDPRLSSDVLCRDNVEHLDGWFYDFYFVTKMLQIDCNIKDMEKTREAVETEEAITSRAGFTVMLESSGRVYRETAV